MMAGIAQPRTLVSFVVGRRTARVEVGKWFHGRGGGPAGGDSSNPRPGKAVFSVVALFLGNRELRRETPIARNARASADVMRTRRGPAAGGTALSVPATRRAVNGERHPASTLPAGEAVGPSLSRDVAKPLDVPGSMACAGVLPARQAVHQYFGTPGRADRFRVRPFHARAGGSPPGGQRGTVRRRSTGGTLAAGGVRYGRTERRAGPTRSEDHASGNRPVLRPRAPRETGEPMEASRHEAPSPFAGPNHEARGGAFHCGPRVEYTAPLVQEPYGAGAVPRAGRNAYP